MNKMTQSPAPNTRQHASSLGLTQCASHVQCHPPYNYIISTSVLRNLCHKAAIALLVTYYKKCTKSNENVTTHSV